MTKGCCSFVKHSLLMAMAFMGTAATPFPSFSAEDKLPTVVSLDYCADQYVLLLSDKKQITAVSDTAEDVFSFYRDRATGIAKTKGTIEEVIMLKPDFAIQTYRLAAHMEEMTLRSSISLIETNYGSDPETVYKNIEMIGAALGQNERAQKFIAHYKKRLHALEIKPERKLKLAYLTPSGVTAGAGTSVDDIITMAGFENYTAAHGFNGWVNLPLENLITDPPDGFIISFFERNAVTQSRWSLGRHDLLSDMMNDIPTINLPSSHMSCNGLFLVDAAELIRKEADAQGIMQKTRGVAN